MMMRRRKKKKIETNSYAYDFETIQQRVGYDRDLYDENEVDVSANSNSDQHLR